MSTTLPWSTLGLPLHMQVLWMTVQPHKYEPAKVEGGIRRETTIIETEKGIITIMNVTLHLGNYLFLL